jgi:hypothetical protein
MYSRITGEGLGLGAWESAVHVPTDLSNNFR